MSSSHLDKTRLRCFGVKTLYFFLDKTSEIYVQRNLAKGRHQNHTCPHRRFWVGLIFEVSDSVFYRSRTNIDIGKTAQHMRNFSKKSNVTPLISDDCSDRPDEK